MRFSQFSWKSSLRQRQFTKMSEAAKKKIIFKTNSSLILQTNLGANFLGDVDETFNLNFAESFFTDSNGISIPEECEELNQLSEQNFVKIKLVIDDIMELQAKPFTCTITVERKIRHFCELYSELSEKHRNKAICYLAENHDVDLDEVRQRAQEILDKGLNNSNNLQRFEDMRAALTPTYCWIFTKIGQLEFGVKFLVDLRAQIIEAAKTVDSNNAKSKLALRNMNSQLRSILSNWFSVGFLRLEQVTWSSPCSMLQKVSEYEAVHPMRNWTDLKARVGPYRRCFVYTHRSMPGEPIVVLHVALTTEISKNISSLVKHHRKVRKSTSMDVDSSYDSGIDTNKAEDSNLCTTGIFYSITSTQTGLQGIELGTFLIKQAVQKLKDEFPGMNQFSTLSPIPGFRSWLLGTLQEVRKGELRIFTTAEESSLIECLGCENYEVYEQFLELIKTNRWIENDLLVPCVERPLVRLCAQYLYTEKRRKVALDPVANFHLKNGATLWRINWLADTSARGLSNSCGMMVNYRYYLENLERNSSNYLENHAVDADESVVLLAGQALKVKESMN